MGKGKAIIGMAAAFAFIIFAVVVGGGAVSDYTKECMASGKYERFECDLLAQQRFQSPRTVVVR